MGLRDKKRIHWAMAQLDDILARCEDAEKQYAPYLERVRPHYREGAINLVHYLAYRHKNERQLQNYLLDLGLGGLKNMEQHVYYSLLDAKSNLAGLLHQKEKPHPKKSISIKRSKKLAERHAQKLFGDKSANRAVRIMVTQPDNAASQPDFAAKMMDAGMNTIRINCAHDAPTDWLAMIQHAQKAMEEKGQQVKITMDLGGPKIRTGAIQPGPKVAHLRPDRDGMGQVVNPARAGLLPEGAPFPEEEGVYIPVPLSVITEVEAGDTLNFTDTRGKNRSLKVVEKDGMVVWVNCYDGAYIQAGQKMVLERTQTPFEVGEIPPLDQFLILNKGDHLVVHAHDRAGEPAVYDQEGSVLQMAHISCTAPEVFQDVEVGEPVAFDDGKIWGTIVRVTAQEMEVEITYAKETGGKLKADKGINLPKSKLRLSGLTAKDREDLKFIVAHADVVNMSFVNHQEDVEELLQELQALGATDQIGVILKIETMTGVRNLVPILLTAMQMEPIGIMIARGDLAIESGWQHVGMIQEEMLKICRAAYVPTVWATQVLENLAKKGVPSRAEITDAVMAQRANAVMLNKGMYIAEAVSLLDTILANMEKVREDRRTFYKEIKGYKA